MTYKRKAIDACWRLVMKYENPVGEKFFVSNSCPLCQIYYLNNKCIMKKRKLWCQGCPLAREADDEFPVVAGCTKFASYINAKEVMFSNYGINICVSDSNNYPLEEFIDRANFFRKIIPILEKISPRRFTPSGWKYFKELDRNW